MVLATMFGRPIITKSTYLQDGSCLIQGVDQSGKECFSFTIKSSEARDSDESDSDELGSWDRVSLIGGSTLMRNSRESLDEKESFYSS